MPTVASFLCDRRQVVRLSGGDASGGQSVSSGHFTTCGTPQGTKIAPIAFLAHINDCATREQHRWKYVDDLSIGICSPDVSRDMQLTANSLDQWAVTNDMKINGKKCQILVSNFCRNAEAAPAGDIT